MAVRAVQAGNETVRLDGIDLQLQGPVRETDLARFQGKVTQGDYSFDSDSTISVWVISSLIGGIGNEYLKEGVDDETYWTGTLETRYPSMITLLPETKRFSPPTGINGISYPVADFPASNPSLYVVFGSTLCRWVEADQEFSTVDTLAGSPTNKGVEQDGYLWIPLGNAGYAIVDDTFVVSDETDANFIAFCLWDNKLLGLTTGGELLIRQNKASSWSAPAADLTLPSGHLPRNLVVFLNQQEDATVHVVTNKDVWAYDPELGRLVRTSLQYPRHPDQGVASAVWRGDAMYVSVGLGIHSYSGSVISAIGPDGRYGLPPELRGRIVDLEPEYNGMVAVVEGQVMPDGEDQDVALMSPTYLDPVDPFRGYTTHSTILRYSGWGWHPIWTSERSEGVPTWALVSTHDNKYRLWWGYAGDMFYQDLRVTFHNPKAGMQVGVDRFAPSGSLTTGWFDADMRGFKKLASHIEITTTDVFGNGTKTGEVKVEFQSDDDAGWQLLGHCDCVGRRVMPFKMEAVEHTDDFSRGLEFNRIRFRITMTSSDSTKSPVLESFLLKYLKIPLSRMSWTITVKLDQERSFMGNGVETTADAIRRLASDGQFHEFIHRNKPYRVRVAQTMGAQMSGHDPRSTMTLSLVEIPLGEEMLKEPDNG